MTVTGEELYALACESQLPIFPFYSVRKLVDCDQVAARGSVVEFMLGERLARMPAAPVQMKGTPWTLRRPAPRKGEHTAHIVDQWTGPGASPRTTTSPASNAESSEEQRLPLAGLRVLDLGQFIAIPFCTLWLAWLGAEVIVVETRKRMTSRTAPPFAPGLEGNPDASAYCNLLNSSKKSVTVDLTTEAGCDLVRRLASVVDVMVDNFSTGVLEKLGLDYATISAQNPRLIAVSCGAFGRSGPMKNARGLHSAVNLFSGVADVTGYVGGHPRILGSVLPDPLSGTYANFAIQAALHHRHRSGRGQFIDLAMYEAMLSLIPEAVIDFSINNRDPRRAGNRDPIKVPHGIYRCRQEGGWVAISVDGDADWKAMCTAAGHAEWHQDPRFANVAARQDHVVLLDQIVGAWTIGLDVDQVTQLLQAAGVAAGPVLRCDQLVDDIRLQARGTVITTDHPVVGSRRQLGLPWRMDSAATHYSRAPLLGEHSRDLLTSLLGLDGAQYDRLVADGVLS
jgi:crotonobetainyl-CoA:carnitine CoA-transferase CaiB-like acyl-CoA transferase